MQELKRNVLAVFEEVNNIWVAAIKEGVKEGIDLTEVIGKVVSQMTELDSKFSDAMQRVVQKKKGWGK